MQPVKVAVVGLRNIGKGHARKAVELPELELVAGVDTDAERLAAAQEEFGFAEAWSDFGECLAQTTAEAVVLALPNQLHEPFAAQALAAGKHVLVEKPMARNAAEAQRMIAARDASDGKVLAVGMNQRFTPAAQSLRQLLADGALGTIYHAKATWDLCRPHAGLWGRGAWFCDAEKGGGGPLIDIGVHKLDLVLWLLGFPEVVEVTGATSQGIGRVEVAARGGDFGVEDFAFGFLRLANGASITVEASYFHNTLADQENTISLHGTLGGFEQDRAFRMNEGEPEELPLPAVADAPTSPIQHFARVVRGQEELIPTPEQALTVARILDAIYAKPPC